MRFFFQIRMNGAMAVSSAGGLLAASYLLSRVFAFAKARTQSMGNDNNADAEDLKQSMKDLKKRLEVLEKPEKI